MPNFNIDDELRPKWSLLDLMLAIKRFGLQFTSNEFRDLDHYLQLVSQVVEIVETLADRGILPYFQDLSSASTSVMALFLKKVSAQGQALTPALPQVHSWSARHDRVAS